MKTSHKNAAEWPYNLVMDLNEDSTKRQLDLDNLPDDFDASLTYVLTLRAQKCPRSVEMLMKYYGEKISYDNIACAYGLTKERIRQIISHERELLLKPCNRKFLESGVYNLIADTTNRGYDRGYADGYTIGHEEGMARREPRPMKHPRVMELDDLDLSVRAHNVLWRAGKRNVLDILAMSYEDLMRLRNAGVKTVTEIITCLENEGFDCSNLKPKEEE